AEELGAGFATDGAGRVAGRLRGRVGDAFRARLASGFGFPFRTSDDGPAGAVAVAAPLLATLTRGPVRYRIAFAGGGHKRALVHQIAARAAEIAPGPTNDPTGSTWEALIDEGAGEVFLVPRRLEDPRFAYRRRDVPAASHPTIAAALARVAGARPDDVVWDPFCGAGTELVERAFLGPFRALLGSDVSPDALAAAAGNLPAAGVAAQLGRADARVPRPAAAPRLSTNPPLPRPR